MARHIYKEKNGTWYFHVELGKDKNGKRRKTKRRGFKTEEEASKALEQFQKVELGEALTQIDYKKNWNRLKKMITVLLEENEFSEIEMNVLRSVKKSMVFMERTYKKEGN